MRNEGTVMNEPQTNEKESTGFVQRPTYNLYHAKKDGNGAASRWELDSNKGAVYLTIANQTGTNENGNGTFGWRRKNKDTGQWEGSAVNMALGLPDISELLLVLYGRKLKPGIEGKGLFHQGANGESVLNFDTYEDKGVLIGYTLQVSVRAKGAKDWTRVRHLVYPGEAETLRILLQDAVLQITGWRR
jgi:hypothetical protein